MVLRGAVLIMKSDDHRDRSLLVVRITPATHAAQKMNRLGAGIDRQAYRSGHARRHSSLGTVKQNDIGLAVPLRVDQLEWDACKSLRRPVSKDQALAHELLPIEHPARTDGRGRLRQR